MKIKTKDMILVSMFAALTAIGAYLQIPTQPIPFTFQFFFCAFSGLILGSRRGIMSQILYIIIGLAGLPIFAGGKGGIQHIFSPTFGYLIGFMLCSYIIGKLTEKQGEIKFVRLLTSVVIGIIVVYIIGVPYLYMIMNIVMKNPMSMSTAIKTGFTIFIIQDLIKCVVISLIGVKIVPILRKSGMLEKNVS
ncbi:hypothetical protein CLPU_15c00260 [Gottschalkia purinilytica]|uniref:Biotin transporter n=1 Tax=Gottschalkia purinilytica TaxID=1503 RepID=A0A0L0W7X3_GOTPU|nr:biotin transporter BioY [Gottschalkia purinilytica]KNF07532.1 hypothetical protein CLPU_15c00260 [Gottschalkia purinilytica]